MHDLSEVFRCMAKSTKLLGSAIYEIQDIWKGPDELWQANYALRALSKGLKFLQAVPHQSPQRLWDWWAYMTQMPFATSMVWPTAPGVGRRVRMRKHSLTTCKQCTTGSVWCVTSVMTTHWPHQTLFTAMASRTVYPPERRAWQVSFIRVIISREQAELVCIHWEPEWRSPEELVSLRLPYWGHLPTHWCSPGGDPDRGSRLPLFLGGACPHALAVIFQLLSFLYSLFLVKGMKPPLYRWPGSLFWWVGAFCIREVDRCCHSSWHRSYLPISLPPVLWLALPTMTQFCDWLHSSRGSLSASINRHWHHSSALHTCSFQGLQPHHITWGLHSSSVDAPVDVHGRSCNFLFSTPGKLYW